MTTPSSGSTPQHRRSQHIAAQRIRAQNSTARQGKVAPFNIGPVKDEVGTGLRAAKCPPARVQQCSSACTSLLQSLHPSWPPSHPLGPLSAVLHPTCRLHSILLLQRDVSAPRPRQPRPCVLEPHPAAGPRPSMAITRGGREAKKKNVYPRSPPAAYCAGADTAPCYLSAPPPPPLSRAPTLPAVLTCA